MSDKENLTISIKLWNAWEAFGTSPPETNSHRNKMIVNTFVTGILAVRIVIGFFVREQKLHRNSIEWYKSRQNYHDRCCCCRFSLSWALSKSAFEERMKSVLPLDTIQLTSGLLNATFFSFGKRLRRASCYCILEANACNVNLRAVLL